MNTINTDFVQRVPRAIYRAGALSIAVNIHSGPVWVAYGLHVTDACNNTVEGHSWRFRTADNGYERAVQAIARHLQRYKTIDAIEIVA
jgi:hypothetical protein